MAISVRDRVVVFDYGEVISLSPTEEDKAVLVGPAGVDAELFWPRYWAARDDLDRGTIDARRYWSDMADDFGASWSPARIHQLWLADFRGWLSVEPGVFELLTELRAGGTRTALLSNAGADYGAAFRFSPVGALFDAVFVSGELGLLKPDAAIYEHVLSELGITAAEMVFIDNRAVNIDGAEAIGITGHVFTGVAGLRAFLESLA